MRRRENERAVRFVVRGRVQGVGFRHFVRSRAAALGVDGWVRNQPDGSVEVMAWGEGPMISELRSALHEGPPWSTVIDVEDEPCPGAERPEGPFLIRR